MQFLMLNRKRKKFADKAGFTLVELILVMMVTVILAASALTGMIRSQKNFAFNGTYQRVTSMVQEVRSLAVTGKAQIDYEDYDHDECKNAGQHGGGCSLLGTENDYITPANYGIYFDTDTRTMTMFADMHGSTVGGFDDAGLDIGEWLGGQDIKLAEYTLSEGYNFVLYSSGGANTVMYSPIFADTTFADDSVVVDIDDFFVFGIEELPAPPGFRIRCMALHRVSGVAETVEAAGMEDKCT